MRNVAWKDLQGEYADRLSRKEAEVLNPKPYSNSLGTSFEIQPKNWTYHYVPRK
jgi:hypothetical protein